MYRAGLLRETITRSYSPTKKKAATPSSPKNTLNTNKLFSEKRESMTRLRCRTVVVVVFMDMVTFNKVCMVGFVVVTNMATITITYIGWCPSTRLELG